MNPSVDEEKDQDSGTRGEKRKVPFHADAVNVEQNRQASKTDECESLGGSGDTSKEALTEQGENDLGKILSQLRKIREAHLAYVNAHTERLKARLAEDEEHREGIIKDMDELEEEIIMRLGANENSEEELSGEEE